MSGKNSKQAKSKKAPSKQEVNSLILRLLKDADLNRHEFEIYLAVGVACGDVIPQIREMEIWQNYLDADLLSIFQQAVSKAQVEITQDDEKASAALHPEKFREIYVQAVHQLIDEGIKKYEVLIPMPSLPLPDEEIEICDYISLEKYPRLLLGLTSETYFPGLGMGAEMTVLKMQLSGYYHFSSGHSLPVVVLAKLREFLTYADLLGLVRLMPGLTPLEFGSSPPLSIFVDQKNGVGPFPILAERKPLYNHLCALSLRPNTPRGLLDMGAPATPYERHFDVIAKIGALLSRPDDDPDLVQIRRAIQWAFEATLADDVSVAMVQSFVALESLLTDPLTAENSGQVSARLAERYAYLVGTTFTDRAQRAQELKALYKVRGDLLHGKLDRSNLDAAHGHRLTLHQVVRQTLWAEIDRLVDLKVSKSLPLI